MRKGYIYAEFVVTDPDSWQPSALSSRALHGRPPRTSGVHRTVRRGVGALSAKVRTVSSPHRRVSRRIDPGKEHSPQRRIEYADSVAMIFIHQTLEIGATKLSPDGSHLIPKPVLRRAVHASSKQCFDDVGLSPAQRCHSVPPID